jgi:hypothetical protein
MAKLIAMVATACIVDGQRVIIQPGQALPELSAHDARELTASGAAKNPDDEAALATAAQLEVEKGAAAFAAARQRVQQEQASTAAPAAESIPETAPLPQTETVLEPEQKPDAKAAKTAKAAAQPDVPDEAK